MPAPARAVAVVFAAGLILACGMLIGDRGPTTLANTSWRAVSINGLAPIPGSEPTAVFKIADVTGSSGCNDWFSPYRYDRSTGRITFDQLAMTARGCSNPEAEPVEQRFSKALSSVAWASMDSNGRLVLSGPGAEILFAVDAVGD